MNKKLLAILFSFALLVLGACGGGDDNAADEPADNNDAGTEEPAENGTEAPAEEEADEGAQNTAAEGIYSQSCASCHGQNLEGNIGPELSAIGSKLSKDEILNVIKNGQGSMPPNLIQGEDAEAVAEWLANKK